jgi:hypothetical protein
VVLEGSCKNAILLIGLLNSNVAHLKIENYILPTVFPLTLALPSLDVMPLDSLFLPSKASANIA